MTFTELEAMEKVATEIYNRGFEDGKKAEYNDFKFSEMQNENDDRPILDKIRAEIDEQYDKVHPYNLSCAEGLEMALGIIDKYKAESEDKK